MSDHPAGIQGDRPPDGEARLESHEVGELAVRGLAAFGVRSLAIRIMAFAANLVLARLLTPHDFGLMAFGLTIMGIGGFITNGGLGGALLRATESPARRTLEAVFGAQLLVASAAAAIIVALALPLGTLGGVAAIMALALPVDCVRVPGALMSERRLDYSPIVRAEMAEMLAYNVVAVGLVVLGAGIWGIAVAVPVRALVGTIVLAQQSRVLVWPRFSVAEVRPLYRFGLRLQGIGFVPMVREQGINVATAAIAGASVLGVFSFAQRLTQPIWLLFEGSWRISYPAMSRLRDAGSDLPAATLRALRIGCVATGAGVVAVAAATPAAVPALFGHKWDEAIPVLPPLLVGLLLGGPVLVCASGFFSALGEPEKLVRTELVVTITTFALGVPLLLALGALGVAVTTLAGTLAGTVYVNRLLAEHDVHIRPVLALALATTCIAGLAGWLVALALGPTAWSMLTAAIVAVSLYAALLFLFQREAAADTVRLFKRMVPRPVATLLPG